MNDAIAFKTRMTGLTTVPIDANKLDQLDTALSEKMRAAPKDFFKASPFIADLQAASALSLTQLQTIKRTFAKHDLLLVGLTNHSLNTDLLTQAGLANIANHQETTGQSNQSSATTATTTQRDRHLTDTQDNHTSKSATAKMASSSILTDQNDLSAKTKVVKRHIRSGQRLYAPEGDLVIIGIVGAGAEVIADGNISILGSLRGRAFAGAKGNTEAFIYTQSLQAELISIAGNYQIMEQLDAHKNTSNVLITLSEDETMQITPI